MKAERVVIDTNVLISATLSPRSAPAKVVAQVLDSCRLVFSDDTFAEFETRLWRRKFDRYLSPGIRQQLLHDFAAVADWVVPGVDSRCWSRDPDDDKFIRTGLAATARWLISGDKDLLVLSSVNDLVILSPSQALQELSAMRPDSIDRPSPPIIG